MDLPTTLQAHVSRPITHFPRLSYRDPACGQFTSPSNLFLPHFPTSMNSAEQCCLHTGCGAKPLGSPPLLPSPHLSEQPVTKSCLLNSPVHCPVCPPCSHLNSQNLSNGFLLPGHLPPIHQPISQAAVRDLYIRSARRSGSIPVSKPSAASQQS